MKSFKFAGIIDTTKFVNDEDKALLRAGGVKRIHRGIYNLYLCPHGVSLDTSTIQCAIFSRD